jgi:hypothetical protein
VTTHYICHDHRGVGGEGRGASDRWRSSAEFGGVSRAAEIAVAQGRGMFVWVRQAIGTTSIQDGGVACWPGTVRARILFPS